MNGGDRSSDGLGRRDFLKRGTVVPLAAMMGGLEIGAAPRPQRVPRAAPAEAVACGIIGFGEWGRELAATLGRLEGARVAAVCDHFPVMLQRAERGIPDARRYDDFRALLDDAAVPAVFVATPTHTHREIVLAALAAGKHVYCEAPLAHTIEDARAIADAARAADKQVFQAGLQHRMEPQHRGVFQFIRSGAIGRTIGARAQWHRKQSWRRASATSARERELNWRLDAAVSPGIAGEIAIHQLDDACWMLQALPVSVRGTGQVMQWRDGRTVPDTIQAVIEFPNDVRLTYTGTLANSFDGAYEMFYGADGTVMVRDNKGWMFKEVDAPLLGWEVYARKDRFYREVGVALVADATKLAAQGIDPTVDDPNAESALYHALEEFLDNTVNGPFPPSAGYKQGYDATVIALMVNEAVLGNTTVAIEESLLNAVT